MFKLGVGVGGYIEDEEIEKKAKSVCVDVCMVWRRKKEKIIMKRSQQ